MSETNNNIWALLNSKIINSYLNLCIFWGFKIIRKVQGQIKFESLTLIEVCSSKEEEASLLDFVSIIRDVLVWKLV